MQYHDELLLKGRMSAAHKAVHEALGVARCETSKLSGRCKLGFQDRFRWAVIKKYEHLVGSKNEYGESYQIGQEFYSKGSAEAGIFEQQQILMGSKLKFIDDYIKKIQYLLGQQAPTMNFGEKLIRSAYGRPFFKIVTGSEIPEKDQTDLNNVLVVNVGIVEACFNDIEYTFCCYEYLQRQLHIGTGTNIISRFAEKLSTPARKLVAEKEVPFGKYFPAL